MRFITLALIALCLTGCRTRGGSMFEFGDEGDGVHFDAPRNWEGLALMQGLANRKGGGDACVMVTDPCTGKKSPISLTQLEALVARINAMELCPDSGDEASTQPAALGIEKITIGGGTGEVDDGGGKAILSNDDLVKLLKAGKVLDPVEDLPSPEPISQRSYPAPPPPGFPSPRRIAATPAPV